MSLLFVAVENNKARSHQLSSPISSTKTRGMAMLNIRRAGKCDSALCSEAESYKYV